MIGAYPQSPSLLSTLEKLEPLEESLPDVDKALRTFQISHTSVSVRLHDMSTEEMLKALTEGRLDVALMIRPSRLPTKKGIRFRPLRKFAVCSAVSPSHLLATSATVGLQKIAPERLVVYSKNDYPEYHAWLQKLFRTANAAPRISEEHDSSTSLIAAVEAGCGIALVQEGFEGLCGSRLIVRPLDPAPPPFEVGVAWREANQNARISAFLEALGSQ